MGDTNNVLGLVTEDGGSYTIAYEELKILAQDRSSWRHIGRILQQHTCVFVSIKMFVV